MHISTVVSWARFGLNWQNVWAVHHRDAEWGFWLTQLWAKRDLISELLLCFKITSKPVCAGRRIPQATECTSISRELEGQVWLQSDWQTVIWSVAGKNVLFNLVNNCVGEVKTTLTWTEQSSVVVLKRYYVDQHDLDDINTKWMRILCCTNFKFLEQNSFRECPGFKLNICKWNLQYDVILEQLLWEIKT